LRTRQNLYLNFSSIPELTKLAKQNRYLGENTNLKKLIQLSSSKKFIGIEFPYFRFFEKSNSVHNLINYLNQNQQKYILDCEKKISKKELIKLIVLSKKLNVKFIRLKCSNILSCERYKYKKSWTLKIDSIVKKIKQIKPLLKKYKVKLAIENHQDLDSNDLINIIRRVGKNYVGINFDIGNSFATCEMPKSFLKRTKNYILNIHLKDYIILPTKSGYGLYRCPIMDGNCQIAEILKIIYKLKLEVPISLELGAKTPREIKVNSNNFFNYFIKEKNIKSKNIKSIMKIAKLNLNKINNLRKLIFLNEINMLNRSLKNINQIKI
jgi:sugar phosphate isomerase/epimerase|tara:strand:+ start:644 stop:1612 length:969 start_codon:yes stop_codon:yes gene_type:complete